MRLPVLGPAPLAAILRPVESDEPGTQFPVLGIPGFILGKDGH